MDCRLLDRHLLAPELLAHPALPELLPRAIATPAHVAERAAELDTLAFPRAELAEVLGSYTTRIDGDAAMQAACRELAQADALTVVTGQQAGLLTGPLYTIYKAITAIRLARAAAEELGRPVVPIFWNATEDHDLSEVANLRFPEQQWRADFPRGGYAAEALSTEPAVREVLDELLASLPELADAEAIRELTAPTVHNYGLYSSTVLARLFRGTGLVILEPRLLRPLARDFFRELIEGSAAVPAALAAGAEAMARVGQAPAFAADEGFGLFHIEPSGERNQVLVRDDRFLLRRRWIERRELLERVDESVEQFSTGAYLRPILQTRLLPTLAYVAGPGELAYHLQLRPLFEHFSVPMPILHPRNHATLLTAREAKLMRQLDLADEAIFAGPRPHYWQRDLPAADHAAFDAASEQLDGIFQELRASLRAPVHPRRHAGYRQRLQSELEALRRKVHRDYLKAAGIDNGRVDRLFRVVCPRESPQERELNVFHFIQAQGPALIEELLACFDPREPRHYLITLDR